MNKQIMLALLFIVLVAIALTIYLIERKKPEQFTIGEIKKISLPIDYEKKQDKAGKYKSAVEFVRPSGFINTDEFALEDLIGKKVILIDFWTYSCINCQRTLPYLNAWHQKYQDMGLEIVGVHTPEFDFEKDRNNVVTAAEKYGVKHKIVQDNEYGTWRAYNNRYWPAKYLIDIDGYIVFEHFGEGMYEETEAKIVELLNERKERLGEDMVAFNKTEIQNEKNKKGGQVYTPETYLGYSRLKAIANLPSTLCLGKECEYTKLDSLFINTFALDGKWGIWPEYIELAEGVGSIILRFSADTVNLVAGSGDSGVVKAEIYLDGTLVSDSMAGIAVDNGVVNFGEYDLYNLIDLRGDYGEHTLEIKVLEPGFEAYAFTFG